MFALESFGHIKEIINVLLCECYWTTSKQQLSDPLNVFSTLLSMSEIFVVDSQSTWWDHSWYGDNNLFSFLLLSSHQYPSWARFCSSDKPAFTCTDWTAPVETNMILFYPEKIYLHCSYLLFLEYRHFVSSTFFPWSQVMSFFFSCLWHLYVCTIIFAIREHGTCFLH